MTVNTGPFGGYTDVTEVISAAAQAQITANVNKLLALIPDPPPEGLVPPGSSAKMPSPDFERIHPQTARQLTAEVKALQTAIGNAPAS